MNSVADAQLQHNWQVIKKGFLYLLFPALLLIFAGTNHYYSIIETERGVLEANEKLNIELGKTAITHTLQGVISDLLYLAGQYELHNSEATGDGMYFNILADEYLLFSKEKGIYDQVRLLDLSGKEIVRVDYNDGHPALVHESRLQDKSSRSYFIKTWPLQKGEIYISPLDLNIEHGQIEKPYKPVLRLATPVFNSTGEKKGILLLNYFGKQLIQNFRSGVANIIDHAMLVNMEGYWLSSPQPENEWGFMFENGNTFGKIYPQAWRIIKNSHSGQLHRADAIYSYTTIFPLKPDPVFRNNNLHNDSSAWKIVSRLPVEILEDTFQFNQFLPLYALMLLLLASGTFIIAYMLERHQYAETQFEFRKRFIETVENINLLAIGLNKEGAITFCNNALLELTGRSRKKVMGADWFETFIPENKRQAARQGFHTVIDEQQKHHQDESEIMTSRNEHRMIAWNDSIMLDCDGKTNGMIRIGRDITESRYAEEELHKVMRAIEQSQSVVIITDINGKIEYVNPICTELTGYKLDEILGNNPRILKSGETTDEEYKNLWKTIKSGNEWHGVFHNRKKNGELYWESASISPIRNAEGKITNFLAVKEDITERKRLEKEVEDRNREIAKNEAFAAVGRMANMIAHDLRNPLSSIKMGLQILGDKPANTWKKDERELKQIALEQVSYVEEILEGLMSYSRPDALHAEWLKLNELLDTVLINLQEEINEHNVKIETSYQSGLPNIYADARKLQRVFANIISNAIQATEGLSDRIPVITICIKQKISGDTVNIYIEITDNGHGIERGTEDRLFEPFFTTRAKGTGLGLAIVNRFVEQHNGNVFLEPVNGGGTMVIVILPTGSIENSNE